MKPARRQAASLAATATVLLSTPLAAGSSGTGNYAYRGSSGGTTEVSSVGPTAWQARAVEATVRPLAGASGSIGLVMHQADASNHYLFLVSTNSTALMIYKRVAGTYTLLGQTPHMTLNQMVGQEHTLRGEDDGAGNLTILWDGTPKLTVSDSTFSSGSAGVRTWSMTADFDDFEVEDEVGATLFSDDFEDGDADGWSGGAAWSVVSTGGGGNSMPLPVFENAFEGGNGEVTLLDLPNWTIYVRPELKGSSPYRAWFHFKLSNLSSEQPTNLVFQSVSFFTRPWYSYDQETWTVFPPAVGGVHSETFTQDEVWVAHSIPYLTGHKDALLADLGAGDDPRVSITTLSTSEGGRPVELLELTAPGPSADRRGIWVVARNHAWEASGSWMADGLARWLVSGEPAARRLLLKARVFIVPIMDVDNVVLGGSGKDQSPIDFNRDWRAEPYWNAVRDAASAIAAHAGTSSYDVFIDSHCPGSSTTFLAVQPQGMVSAPYWQNFLGFRALFVAAAAGSALPYAGSYSEWGPTYHPLWYQMSFWHQFTTHPELKLSLTLETAVGSARGYRELSRAFGRALEAFLPWPEPIPRFRMGSKELEPVVR